MSMIAPEEVFQHSQQYFHTYRPIVEELYEVDLSGILLKDTEGYILDELAAKGVVEDDEEARQEILRSEIVDFNGKYWNLTHSVYIFSNRPRSDQGVAKTVVHELGHAAHYSLMRQDRAMIMREQPLWKIVREGFAESVELEAFAPHYDLPGIDAHLKGDRIYHWLDSNIYKFFNLQKMYESLDDKTRIENTHRGLRFPMRCKTRMLNWLFGKHEEYYGPLGYTFFKRAADEDVDVFDVLRNPPEDIESIIDPADYIKEMSS